MFTIAIEIDTDDKERIEDIIRGLNSVTAMMPERTRVLVWPGNHHNKKEDKDV